MSQEIVHMVRQPMAVGARSRRRLVERLGLRFPGATAFLGGLGWRLPTHSRLGDFEAASSSTTRTSSSYPTRGSSTGRCS